MHVSKPTDFARHTPAGKNNRPPLTRMPIIVLLASISCGLWGSAAPCIKLGLKSFQIDPSDTWSILLFAGLRFALAGLFVIIVNSLSQARLVLPRPAAWPKILPLAFFQTILQYLLFYIGTAHATGAKSSIIVGSGAFVSVFVACLLFRQEKLKAGKILGCAIGFLGILLINLKGNPGSASDAGGLFLDFTLTGEGFVLLSTVASAVSASLIRQFSQKEDPLLLSGYQFLVGGSVLTVIGLTQGGHLSNVTPGGLLLLFYMACISSVAYSLWGILLKWNPVSRITVFDFLTPVFGVLLSALLLGETDSLNLTMVLSLMLVCIGICVVNREEKTPR